MFGDYITLFGSGKSTPYLIDYLLGQAPLHKFTLRIIDRDWGFVSPHWSNHPHCELITLEIDQEQERKDYISTSKVVVSMLPAHMHGIIAADCLMYRVPLATASYVSENIRAMESKLKEAGVTFLFEMGLDPGLDHMSAMELIDDIRAKGGAVKLFESFAGGLVAPESDDNPWKYKFSWNPRNVVLAGQGGAAKFLQEGTYKYIPYHKLFRRIEFMEIEGYGKFEAYPNRDSLAYQKAYGLDDALTLFRGTIRRVGFSKAWNHLVQLGMTDDSYSIEHSGGMSYRAFTNLFLPYSATDRVELKLRHYLNIAQDDPGWEMLSWLGLFSETHKIERAHATPAQALQEILEKSWTMGPEDKDMIVMYHKIGYELDGEMKQIDAYMVSTGEDRHYTAMAKTVGLPLAIGAMQLYLGRFKQPGIHLPLTADLYRPVLKTLQETGIVFHHKETAYRGYNPGAFAVDA